MKETSLSDELEVANYDDSEDQQCELYRHFDSNGELLYVGISLSSVARLAQHRRSSVWFDRIKRVEIEAFPTREAAIMAESRAIETEKPKFNVMRGTYSPKPNQFVRMTCAEIRKIINPRYLYSHDQCCKILALKSTQLTKLTCDGKIGCVLLDLYAKKNGRLVQFSGQNIIDYIEIREIRENTTNFEEFRQRKKVWRICIP